jgi:hypothetical protein
VEHAAPGDADPLAGSVAVAPVADDRLYPALLPVDHPPAHAGHLVRPAQTGRLWSSAGGRPRVVRCGSLVLATAPVPPAKGSGRRGLDGAAGERARGRRVQPGGRIMRGGPPPPISWPAARSCQSPLLSSAPRRSHALREAAPPSVFRRAGRLSSCRQSARTPATSHVVWSADSGPSSRDHSAAVPGAAGLYRGVRANTEQTCLVRPAGLALDPLAGGARAGMRVQVRGEREFVLLRIDGATATISGH